MNAGIDVCLSFVVVCVTLFVGLSLGQDISACDVSKGTHGRGICGARLARAHANLCFLLRNQFPDVFQRKRSVENSIGDVFSIPLSTLADVDLARDDSNKKTNIPPLMAYTDTNALLSTEPRNFRDLFLTLRYSLDNSRPKRQSDQQPRDIVCECCINNCTARQLATYC
ncbi:molluscan insulin-related peptide 7-like [Biomphalaria glabrata]|uniref:Molluscan insulin-related peptide 7-like n=1 Tax=Biomphalaria glabrata TaxID=6526 RepID=A0A9W3AS15_BIOGL|nr:molluscan insulin-related peptide 7-like [Biomphalaria glabrata]XP_055889886.1 molluscan insulin-related peptide 7-like [Biomphalaria glabrata]XP_055889887.1 molluscan insulin-related peptide 7-like [Biomphalaria glabrata]XP_055889888.1 molluscan insulin-related peptide 7-like [Biomphalaria glabrata]XP_055889889.1 molluscan insulin-related peptide 7-like [Biomphalaria glabrata]